jgi:peptide subunit release factor RF-3
MEQEYNEEIILERQPFVKSRWLGSDVRPATASTIAYDEQNRPLILFKSDWEISYVQERTPGLVLLENPEEVQV